MRCKKRTKVACMMMIVVIAILLTNAQFKNRAYETLYGKASWYSMESVLAEGNTGITASREQFYDDRMTCATRSRNFGKIYIVTNLDNDKSVVCWKNDVGPGNKATNNGVIIDLSKGAFNKIADLDKGVVNVRVQEFK